MENFIFTLIVLFAIIGKGVNTYDYDRYDWNSVCDHNTIERTNLIDGENLSDGFFKKQADLTHNKKIFEASLLGSDQSDVVKDQASVRTLTRFNGQYYDTIPGFSNATVKTINRYIKYKNVNEPKWTCYGTEDTYVCYLCDIINISYQYSPRFHLNNVSIGVLISPSSQQRFTLLVSGKLDICGLLQHEDKETFEIKTLVTIYGNGTSKLETGNVNFLAHHVTARGKLAPPARLPNFISDKRYVTHKLDFEVGQTSILKAISRGYSKSEITDVWAEKAYLTYYRDERKITWKDFESEHLTAPGFTVAGISKHEKNAKIMFEANLISNWTINLYKKLVENLVNRRFIAVRFSENYASESLPTSILQHRGPITSIIKAFAVMGLSPRGEARALIGKLGANKNIPRYLQDTNFVMVKDRNDTYIKFHVELEKPENDHKCVPMTRDQFSKEYKRLIEDRLKNGNIVLLKNEYGDDQLNHLRANDKIDDWHRRETKCPNDHFRLDSISIIVKGSYVEHTTFYYKGRLHSRTRYRFPLTYTVGDDFLNYLGIVKT